MRLLSVANRDQHAATHRILEELDGSTAIARLMGDAIARGGRHSAAALQLSMPVTPLACGKGCHHCCWATVGVIAPDAIYVADELRGRLPKDELDALRVRSGRLSRRLQRMDRGERLAARLPCLLLRDRACSSYHARPLVCRWACSPSLQACLDHLVHRSRSGLEMEDVRYQPTQEVWLGLRAALSDRGLDTSLLSLNSALAIALEDSSAAERYLAGEPVFVAARIG